MIRINEILDKIASYAPESPLDLVERAYVYSARVHAGQVRLSGEPYLLHPLEVAHILAEMRLDVVSVAAGLLHDVLEDTGAQPDELRELFGGEVLGLVSGVTKLSQIPTVSSRERQAENLRKMFLAMARDIRVILIKLADRLHNMRTLRFHSPEKRREIAQETMDIYAPIAGRLGIYWIKTELEENAFKYLHPEEYAQIEHWVATSRSEREAYIEKMRGIIRRRLEEMNLKAEVLGRSKNFYSIFSKMKKQNLSFDQIYDLTAFRIILDTVPQCYEALGLIHSMWKPIDFKFKDYIGRPKPNMYQSLHTTVIGPSGERIEIQIRTWEMDRIAKSGIAAHWSYKEGQRFDENLLQKLAWIQDIVENQENFRDAGEFLENVRIDLFPDEVYVFTPKGDIRALPKGSTPVDFAYLIHTEIGHRCVGARVNGQMVSLTTELQTGDIVEILTAHHHHPSKDWLKFVRTIKARSKIRQWIKTQERERSISLGREMLEKAFRKERQNFLQWSRSEKMEAVTASLGYKTFDDLVAAVGYGKVTPLQVVRPFLPSAALTDEPGSILGKLMSRVRRRKPRGGVLVRGMEDILIKFGRCCQPVPGDPIIGYITQGFGVTVHRAGCVNALRSNPERQIEVEWNLETTDTFPVKIQVISTDRMGLLADLVGNISKLGANILHAASDTRENRVVESRFTIMVRDKDHLERILGAVRRVKQVQDAWRVS